VARFTLEQHEVGRRSRIQFQSRLSQQAARWFAPAIFERVAQARTAERHGVFDTKDP